MQINAASVYMALYLAVVLAVAIYKIVLQQLPAAKRAQLEQEVSTVVRAVEQANQAMPGPAKKALAQQLLGGLMAQAHLSASPERLDVLIEAAVHALNAAKPVAVAVKV